MSGDVHNIRVSSVRAMMSGDVHNIRVSSVRAMMSGMFTTSACLLLEQ